MLTHELLTEVLEYDPSSGELRWKVSGKGIQRGAVAGRSRQGRAKYATIKIDQRAYSSHRVIWLYMTGEWPSYEIDHINHDCFDNRWSNLRQATRSQNNANRRPTETGQYSKLKGVSFYKGTKRFTAGIKVNGRSIHLGCFDTDVEAHQAYCIAAKQYFGAYATTS